jgi:hypothetical protein
MSNYTYADLFDKSASKKEITIETEDKSVKITNSEIHFEQFELKEILCDDDYLTFGQCNASQLKFKISNVFTSMIGKQINVSAVINGHTDTPFIFGKYRVVSDKPTDDKRYRNVTAYDAIYDIGESEVSSWYNGLKFPLTLKQFRDSFFSYFGVEQVATTLPNDSMEVAETIKPNELSGQTVMEAICSINGCFGHINHDGKFEYVFLKAIISGLYPKKGLYPQKGLYPRKGSEKEKVTGGKYKSVKYEDFACQKVTKVQIRKSENDIGAVYPDTEITENDNSYILQDNFLVYGMSADDLETVARNLYEVIKVVKYRPYNCEKIGNPCLSLGEAVNVYTAKEIIESYVLSRTYKGIQQPTDTISASGKSPKYSEQVNGINKSIIQLRGKTNELERTVEETRSEIKDVESGLDTKITQTAGKIELESTRAQGVETDLAAAISVQADQIKLKVSKGDVSAQLSIESGQVSISGNRFVLDSTNFSISADGKVTAKSIDIQGGTINLQSAAQNYSTIVLNYSNYTLGMDGAGIRASRSSDSTILTASGITTTGSLKAKNLYVDNINTQSVTSGTISIGNNVKISGDTELAIGHTHKINGNLNIDVNGLSINAPALNITSTGGISVGKSLGYLGFFGIQGSTKKTVSKISSTSTTAASTVANKVNDLITALQAYGLIG